MSPKGTQPAHRVLANVTAGPRRWIIAGAAAAAISYAAYRRGSLSGDGALAATGVGTVTFACGGLPAAGALNAFFLSGSALSRFKRHEKARRGTVAPAKGGRRDAWQVFANGGIATLALVLGRAGRIRTETADLAFVGALAAASADSWATELGMLSRFPPRLITDLRRTVPTGLSGGVTLVGLLASLLGATIVGATWIMLRPGPVRSRGTWPHAGDEDRPLRPGTAQPRRNARPASGQAPPRTASAHPRTTHTRGTCMLGGIILAGLVGSLADSLLGATVQALSWCPACDAPTESATHAPCGGTRTQLTRGFPWADNDVVNVLATLVGSIAGVILGNPGRVRRSVVLGHQRK